MKKLKELLANKDLLFYVGFFIFPVLQFVIFYIVVNFNSILLAFQSYDALTGEYFFDGFTNFLRLKAELFDTPLLGVALVNSVKVWFFTTLLGTALAVFFSYYIFKKCLFNKLFRVLLFLPTMLPAILLTILYKIFMNEAIPGYASQLFGIDLPPLLQNADTREFAVMFFVVWTSFGTQVLLYTGSMEQISQSVIEAGQLDGVKPMRELFSIILPDILPAVNTFILTGIANLFVNQAGLHGFFGTNAASTEYTIGYYLFILVNREGKSLADYTYASALGLCCTLFVIPITFVLRWGLRKLEAI